MKLFDLRLRGSWFTLGTIVNEHDHFMFREVIFFLQYIFDKDAQLPQSFAFQRKKFEHGRKLILTKKRFDQIKRWAVSNGYCTADGDTLTFTEKALDVFQKTIARDEELSKSGFSYCPCAHGCGF
jgi:hypothetical protein